MLRGIKPIDDQKPAGAESEREAVYLKTRIKQRTHEITAEKEKLELAIDTIPGLVWSSLPDGNVDFLNLRWREYAGMTLEEARGWGWQAAIHPDDLPGLESYWRSMLKSGQPGETEARLRRFDGVFRWHLFRAVPLYDAAGTLIQWYGETTDIDDRQRAEERLRCSESYLAAAQKLSRTGSFGWNVKTGKLTWSDETYCILDYDQQVQPTLELILNRVHPEDVELVQAAIERASHEQTEMDFEHRLVSPSGRIKHVHVRARAEPGGAAGVEFVGAVMDITVQKCATEALRVSEHLARGQLGALTGTLESLARESDPDKLPKHVLTTILSQLGAHSVSMWERNDGMLNLLGVVEENRFHSQVAAGNFEGGLPLVSEQAPPFWNEALGAGHHILIEDIDREPARIVSGDGRSAVWPTEKLPSAFAGIKARLASLGVRALLVAPMMMDGRIAGIIGIRFTGTRLFRREEIDLTKALAHQAMLAIRLMRLSQQSRRSAVIAERNRFARDIHDTLAQGFTGVIVQLEAAADANGKGLAIEAEDHVARASALARESLREARRSVQALRPLALEGRNVAGALEDLIRGMTAGVALQAHLSVEGVVRPIPSEWEENILRIGQEALTNALRHAASKSFQVELIFAAKELRVRFKDEGRGFDPTRSSQGFGLLGIRERVDAMGGRLSIQSAAGSGTQIEVLVPLTAAATHLDA
jgi:PAS domain S-box-containing protein